MSSSKKSSSSTSGTKSQSRRATRKLNEREQTMRDLEHAKSLLNHARKQMNSSTNDNERTALQQLVNLYTGQIATHSARMEAMNATLNIKKKEDAVTAAIRRMGKALPSKTLETNPELLTPLRDAIMRALPNDDARQVFLAGIGSAQQDMSKAERRKKRTKRDAEDNSSEGDESEGGDSSQSVGDAVASSDGNAGSAGGSSSVPK